MRLTALAAVILTLGPSMANAQPSAPVVTKTDVDLRPRRRLGAARQHCLSRRPVAQAGDPFGSWRTLARRQSRRCEQHQGRAVGGVRLLRDVDRLSAGRRIARAGAAARLALRDPLAACARGGVPDRSGARLSDRPVGRRANGVARRHRRRSRLPARRRLGEGAHRRARGDQRRGDLRTEFALLGQSLDARSTARSKKPVVTRRRSRTSTRR